MNAFVEMRHFIASNASMFEQIRSVELRQLEYQKTTDERFERVFDYMESHEAPSQKVFFEGQVYDAFELLVGLVQRARREGVCLGVPAIGAKFAANGASGRKPRQNTGVAGISGYLCGKSGLMSQT